MTVEKLLCEFSNSFIIRLLANDPVCSFWFFVCSFSDRYFEISSCMNGAKPWFCFYFNLLGNKQCLLFILCHVLSTKWLIFVLTCFYIMQRWHFVLYKGLFLWFRIFCAYLICKNYCLSCHSLILYFFVVIKNGY